MTKDWSARHNACLIEIKLKEDASEFANTWRLESIIKKHSDYVSFPIYVITETPVEADVDSDESDEDVIDVQATTETEKVVTHRASGEYVFQRYEYRVLF